jgi:HEAT repeat protein
MLFLKEAEELKRSDWPRCDQLADALANRGPAAADALEYAGKVRKKHVRSAALRAMAKIDTERARAMASSYMSDNAYEVREAAMIILGITPEPEVRRGYRLKKPPTKKPS